MATTKQYFKVCPDCNGEAIRREEGKVFWGIFKTPATIIICKRCGGTGKIQPKTIIAFRDKVENKLIY